MLNLIQAEIFKLKRQRLLPVLSIAVIAVSAFSAFSEITFLSVPESPLSGKTGFANAFQDVFMLFVMAILAAFFIGTDFLNRTIQAALSKGQKRSDVILSKAVVFSAAAALLMLLYPVTVCLVQTAEFGWGEPFGLPSLLNLLRVSLMGSVLNVGTAGIYVCLAFLCRDIPKTLCVCFAFPVVFSAVSGTLGKQVPLLGRLLDLATLSQLKYIVGDSLDPAAVVTALLSAFITMTAALAVGGVCFSRAELK